MGTSTSIIERAFQLAPQCTGRAELKLRLKREGYDQIDAHLSGKQIRADLAKAFKTKAGPR
jgi:hypothetical protein